MVQGLWQDEPYEQRFHDDLILRAVERTLSRLDIDATVMERVDVDVLDREVLLEGTVPERWMQLDIEHACLHVTGVRDVVSHLAVYPG